MVKIGNNNPMVPKPPKVNGWQLRARSLKVGAQLPTNILQKNTLGIVASPISPEAG